jgi:O-antigen/teichoic acid export membrane protein
VANRAIGLFLVPVYARHLKANQFGVLTLLAVSLTLVTIVLKFGLNHAFFRHYYEAQDDQHRRRIVGSTLIFLVTTSLLFTSLLCLAAPQVSRLVFAGESARADLLQLVFVTAFFEVITLIPDSILRARFKSATYSILNIASFAVQMVLIAYLVLAVEPSVENVLLGRLGGTAFEALIFFIAARRDLSLKFSFSELRGMLGFGAPLIFGQLAFILFMMIDRFFLQRYSTEREVGFYGMAAMLVSVVTELVTVPFSQVWTVMRFSVMNEEGAEMYYARVLTYIGLVSMFLALGVAAVSGDGLLLFGTRGYWPAASIIPLLSFAAVLDSASRVLNVGITLKKRTIFGPIVIAAALGVNIGLNFLLIPRYGSLGASVSTLFSFAVFCALRYWASNLFFKVHYEWGRVFTIGLVGALLMALFYLNDYLRGDLSQYSLTDPARKRLLYSSILIKVFLTLSFPAILWALRFYSDNELRRVADAWRRLSSEVRRRPMSEAIGD